MSGGFVSTRVWEEERGTVKRQHRPSRTELDLPFTSYQSLNALQIRNC